MSKTYNHKCIWCGKEYEHCDKCKRINSWKAICCTPQCYQDYIESVKDKDVKKVREEIKENQKLSIIIDDVERDDIDGGDDFVDEVSTETNLKNSKTKK